ncbi:hypothetical protein I6G46_07730 [Serratia plymuthica]|uniref:MBL fold metallo-hydrolase n=1 Tax=Serratia plymuthica TaxID=82996 RepID=UPI0018D9FD7B|nr:MBL fold metallo-hydrolase [Serratia plymuthica]QPS88841.1 hypothetical protein I6G46_07730 [Serratia plymuthica]
MISDEFIAIEVGCGDAFFLRRSGHKILVDGGKSAVKFPKLFLTNTRERELDIIICTHCDADHVNGLLGYYRSKMLSKELWLPGSWTHRLDDLIEEPIEFLFELYNSIVEHNSKIEITDTTTLQDIGNEYSRNRSINDVEFDNRLEDKNRDKPTKKEINADSSRKKENVSKIKNAIIIISIVKEWGGFPSRRPHYAMKNRKNIERLFKSAIESASNILELAALAYEANSKVRWFEYSEHQAEGGENYLHPVNSVEILSYKKNVNALYYLSLTKANIESLVFYSPDEKSNCGVLFTADSNFEFKQSLDFIQTGSIITTPHHGSEHNINTYIQLANHIGDNNIFVRSDSKSDSRPCNAYISLPQEKHCTICNNNKNNKKISIKFVIGSGKWMTTNNICSCI